MHSFIYSVTVMCLVFDDVDVRFVAHPVAQPQLKPRVRRGSCYEKKCGVALGLIFRLQNIYTAHRLSC